jgi:hypothetical protein
MKYVPIILGFVTSGMATAVPLADGPPLPVGEIGWQGSANPGRPIVEVWGQGCEVRFPSEYPFVGSSGITSLTLKS